MDITFWVLQAVLLMPVLFMAAAAGIEAPPTRQPTPAGLSQFTAEQRARLVILRAFVQEARRGRGTWSDDVDVTPERAAPASTVLRRPPGRRTLTLLGGALLLLVGLVGIVGTNARMDGLQLASGAAGLSPAARFLPGVIGSPAKYLSAVNGGSATTGRVDDPLVAVEQMELKQAMDRWEALVGFASGLLLFANASRAAASETEDDGSVGVDVAPFVLVAAALFAALSFFELP